MDSIGVIGISWRRVNPESLARFTVPVEARLKRLPEIAREIGVQEFLYLATCNRVEVALVADQDTAVAAYRTRLFTAFTGRPARPGEPERTFHAWMGEGAAEHLALVASGLDSARIGETEVLGQVREAYDLSHRLGLTGPKLELVLEEVLRIAARVHRATGLGTGRISLAEIALDRVRARLKQTPGPVALVGISPMTVRCARALAEESVPLYIVNRTFDTARALAQELGATARSLKHFRRHPDAVEALVLSTGSSKPVIPRSGLECLCAASPSGEPPLVVDMAIPPDVLPEDARAAGLERVGMEEVTAEAEVNRNHRLVEMADARALVDEALVGLRRRLADRVLAPLLAALHRNFRRTAEEGVARLLRKGVKRTGELKPETVLRWAENLAGRFARIPTLGLRGVAYEVGAEGVKAFLDGLDEDLARELLEAAERFEGLPEPGDGEGLT